LFKAGPLEKLGQLAVNHDVFPAAPFPAAPAIAVPRCLELTTPRGGDFVARYPQRKKGPAVRAEALA